MLKNEIISKIEEFVYKKPRSIQEIAEHINKNWRTADRYIEEIKNDFGTIDVRVFRKGTRGALKIVYWSAIDKISNNAFQKELENRIINLVRKEDFKAFDIFQFVEDKNKEIWAKNGKNEVEAGRLDEFAELLQEAKRQVLFFSGNLSFINFKDKKTNIFETIEELVKKGISIKVICHVDWTGKKNVEKLLSLNFKHKKNIIEIRNRQQPLRVTVIDGKIINLKEINEPTRKKELEKKLFVFYTIRDKQWGEWISRIFWKMFSSSISAERRIEEMDKLGLVE